ncbi:hypothetical protein CVT26_003562 [Gymnopilus dilepis]|uniref:Uncharacterized protein n=1 Tax=Gymnopilus dilepis TaxID=231916 RepID=A0A409VS82_9AGAR|nr:hypothetical protein CVT26_003562 [Gymnopilus dilepis]
MHNVGAIPLYVSHHFADAEGRHIHRGSPLKLGTCDDLLKHALSYFPSRQANPLFDQAFIMRRIEHSRKSDRILLDFRSELMEKQIVEQFKLLIVQTSSFLDI